MNLKPYVYGNNLSSKLADQVEGMQARTSQCLLLVGALGVLSAGVLQAFLYLPAQIALSNSGLSVSLQEAFRAQWVAYAIEMFFISALLLIAVVRTVWVGRPAIVLSGILCLIEAGVAHWFHEGLLSYLLAASAISILCGSFLRRAFASS